MSKKEINAWDRFWLSVKANEKLIWVVLLVVLAPTFAFTSQFYSWLGSRNPVVATVFGRKLKNLEWLRLQRSLAGVGQFMPNRFYHQGDGRGRADVFTFLMYLEEADRLGIRVSDPEVGAVIRSIYWQIKAEEEAIAEVRKESKAGKKDQDLQMALYRSRYLKMKEFSEKRDQFSEKDQEDWHAMLVRSGIERGDFEDTLRQVLQAQRVESYVRSTVQVTPEEELEDFKKEEQSRKFTFFEVKADEARAEVEKSVTDAEIKDHYEKHKDEFREPLKIRTEYLSVPIAAFEKQVQLTDEDLKKEYERVKTDRYQTFVGGGVESGFDLLTPEEKAAREKKAFRPFEEVKEQVRTDLVKLRAREEALKATRAMQERLFPRPQGAIGDKKDDKTPAPATFADIQKDFPMVKTGTTPWVERSEAERVMADAYSPLVGGWFNQAQGPSAKKEIQAPQSFSPAGGADIPGYVFYKNPQLRPAGVPKFADVTDRVKEAVVKAKLLEKAKAKADGLAKDVREGKKSLEDAAKESGTQPVQTGFVERGGPIKIPLTPEEAKKAEEERKAAEKKDIAKKDPTAADAEPPRKDKAHPGSSVILEYGFKSVREKGKVEGSVEDPANSAAYVVRWDDAIYPDPASFDDSKRRTYHQKLQNEKEQVYLADWQAKLRERANPEQMVAQGEGGKQTRVPAPQYDPFAE
jgi:hypothetical protein